MENVRKNDGRRESFDRNKIVRSVLNAGADERTAREIANIIPEEVATTTKEIRKKVSDELGKKDAQAVKRYEHTRNLMARKAVDAAKGTVWLTTDTMDVLNLKPGDPVELVYADKKHSVKAETGASYSRNVHLNEEDLKTIGASEGKRVVVRNLS